MLDAALDYAARGWPVFPLRPAAKTPATKNGFKAATLDPDVITRWWTERPALNVGISTGPAHLLVVDLDYKPDDGVNGFANWCALLDELGADTGFTRTTWTPSGGMHFTYTLDAGWCIGNSAGKLGPGIDVRAEGGYIVAPPSTTAAGVYELDENYPTDPVPAPAWLVDKLKPQPAPAVTTWQHTSGDGSTRYGRAALERELGQLALAANGTRNDALVRSSFRLGQLVAGGQLDPGEVSGALLVVALRIGLTETEAQATIESGFAAGLLKPKAPNERR